MDERDLAQRAFGLPDKFAGRLAPDDLASVREFAEAGEWAEELDLLVAALVAASQPVSPSERDELTVLLGAAGVPTDPIGRLSVGA
ncbi:MAG TPA: hypothetical protein VHZ03_15985 [Trebonia sp.]|jgi:hypothetical protein|nr:hypothetical protein [Trebonia sp.]